MCEFEIPPVGAVFGRISARFLNQGFPAFGLCLFVLHMAAPSTKLSILMGESSYEFLFALFACQLYLFRQGMGFSSTCPATKSSDFCLRDDHRKILTTIFTYLYHSKQFIPACRGTTFLLLTIINIPVKRLSAIPAV